MSTGGDSLSVVNYPLSRSTRGKAFAKNSAKHIQKQKNNMTYSSSLAMGRQRYARRGQNTTAFKREKAGLGPVSNTIILIVLGCILGLLYLTQVTKTNAFGYKINELRNESSSLQSEHDELEVASARLQSLERVKNSPASNEMVSVAQSGIVQN